MTDDLHDALTATMRSAAHAAPAPAGDLLDRVQRGHRARRRRGAVAVAGTAAMVTLVSVGVVALPAVFDAPTPQRPAAGPMPTVQPPEAVPVTRLWPQAVHQIPARLPDDRKIRPVTMVDDDTVLVATESSAEKTDELLAYDLRTADATSITRVTYPKRSTIFASDITVGDGHVAWSSAHRIGTRYQGVIQAAPLTGGPAQTVTTWRADREIDVSVSRMMIGDGKVVWTAGDTIVTESANSEPLITEMREVSLTGGRPRAVPGTKGFDLLTWPWAGGPAYDAGGPGFIVFRTLRNLRTGETRTAVPEKKSLPTLGCAVTWCTGEPEMEEVKQATKTAESVWLPADKGIHVRRRDGGDAHTLLDLRSPEFGTDFPVLDRFLLVTRPQRSDRDLPVIYDLRSGKLADPGVTPKPRNVTVPTADHPAQRLYWFKHKGGYRLIDLAKVE